MNNFKKYFILPIFFVGIVVFVVACGNNSEATGFEIINGQEVTFEVSEDCIISDGLNVSDNYIMLDNDYFDLVTIISNGTEKDVENVHIVIELYNEDDRLVETKTDDSGILTEGKSYRCSIPISIQRKITYAKIVEISFVN